MDASNEKGKAKQQKLRKYFEKKTDNIMQAQEMTKRLGSRSEDVSDANAESETESVSECRVTVRR
ncbi:hypothetical protein DPMN_105912 [Dreissena polymorpha]|uniref:Uncharacterized protein n=1 Tax=Dreissena polymorpha TaxID=45954 RepID=A0A9D4QJ65_DREPO|nr:hypothetical protein DPMN_105912 [Dreissena polymorpha]